MTERIPRKKKEKKKNLEDVNRYRLYYKRKVIHDRSIKMIFKKINTSEN